MKFLAAEISGREGGNLSVVQIVSSCYPDSLYDVFRWFLYSVRNSLNESSETSEQTVEAPRRFILLTRSTVTTFQGSHAALYRFLRDNRR